MEMTWDEKNEHIDRNGPRILRMLVPLLMSPDVLKQLVKEDVLLDYQEETLRHIADPSSRCAQFLDLVKGGSVQMYYNLVKVAKINKQSDLVKLLVPTEHRAVAQQPTPMAQQPESLAEQPVPLAQQPAPMAQQPAQMAQPMTVEVGEKEIPLWDKRHPNGKSLLHMQPGLGRKLDRALPNLKKLVRPSNLWAYLQKYGVMDSSNREECQAAGVTGSQVEAIVKYLKQDLLWKLHAFFRSLAQIEQGDLIDLVLGEGAQESYNKNKQSDLLKLLVVDEVSNEYDVPDHRGASADLAAPASHQTEDTTALDYCPMDTSDDGPILPAPKDYDKETWAELLEITCVKYDPTTDTFSGPTMPWKEKTLGDEFMVAEVVYNGKDIMTVGEQFYNDTPVRRRDVHAQPDAKVPSLFWQTSSKIWTIEEKCLIGAVVTPLLDPAITFEWYKIADGERKLMQQRSRFIEVVPGTYTAKIYSYVKGVRQDIGMLNSITVQTSTEFFKDVAILQRSHYRDSPRSLGEGRFGDVVRGTYQNEPVAIKKIRHLASVDQEMLKAEIRTAGTLRHQNLVQQLGVCILRQEVHIVMELLEGRDLQRIMTEMVENKTKQCLTDDRKSHILKQVCDGLSYMHSESPPVVHSDVKPANIMVKEDDQCVKIIDFSFARPKTHPIDFTTVSSSAEGKGPGTLHYMAPEVQRRQGKRRQPSADIWSLGLVITELFNNGQLVGQHDGGESCKEVANIPEQIKPMIYQALSRIKRIRPTAAAIGAVLEGLSASEDAESTSSSEEFSLLLR